MTEPTPGILPTLENETEVEFYLFTFYLRLPRTKRTIQTVWDNVRQAGAKFPAPYNARFPVRQKEAPKALRTLARRNKWSRRALALEIRTQEMIAKKTAADVALTRDHQVVMLDKQLHASGRALDLVWDEIKRRIPTMSDATTVNLLRTLLGQMGQMVRTRALPAGEATGRVEFSGALKIAHALLGTDTVDDILDKVPGALDMIAEPANDQADG